MNLKFLVEVNVRHLTGKFASREEIATQIKEALEGADPNTYDGDNGGEYETESWQVDEHEEKK